MPGALLCLQKDEGKSLLGCSYLSLLRGKAIYTEKLQWPENDPIFKESWVCLKVSHERTNITKGRKVL